MYIYFFNYKEINRHTNHRVVFLNRSGTSCLRAADAEGVARPHNRPDGARRAKQKYVPRDARAR